MRKSLSIAALFVLLSVAFFFKAFAHNLLITGPDGLLYFYPLQSVIIEQYRAGVLPLWNSYMYSGFPLMASSQHGVFYLPYIIPTFFFSHGVAYNIDMTLHFAMAGFFTYLYVRKITSDTFSAFIAGVIFAFMGYLMSHVEHVSVLHTAAWFPLLLYFYEEIRLRLELRTALFASIAVAMQLFAGHPQIYFYCMLVMAFYVVFYLFYMERGRRLRFVVLCALPVALGILIASPQLVATRELSSLGVRGLLSYQFFSSYSLRFDMLPVLLYPKLPGEREAFALSVGLLLAPVALWRMRTHGVHVKFWGLVAVVSFVLALGGSIEPLNRLMFHIPLYNGFRGLSKHVLEFTFAVSVLAAIGLSGVLRGDDRKRHLDVLIKVILVAIAASALAFAFTEPGTLMSAPLYGQLAAMGAVVAALLLARHYGRYGAVRIILIVAVVVQIAALQTMQWPEQAFVKQYGTGIFPKTEMKDGRAAFFAKDIVAPLAMMKGVSMIDGYDPLIMLRYAKLMGMGKVGGRTLEWQEMTINNQILSMLNVRYVFMPPGYELNSIVSGRPWEAGGGFMRPVPGSDGAPLYKKLLQGYQFSLYENLNALPRAFSVESLVPSADIDETKDMLYDLSVNVSKTAIVSPEDLKAIGSAEFSKGSVAIGSYYHGRVALDTDFPRGRGFVVLADQYYPGWRAYVDGKRTEIYRANGVVRGVVVPEGRHEVVFRYLPMRVFFMMGIALITLLGVIAAAWALGRRKGAA